MRRASQSPKRGRPAARRGPRRRPCGPAPPAARPLPPGAESAAGRRRIAKKRGGRHGTTGPKGRRGDPTGRPVQPEEMPVTRCPPLRHVSKKIVAPPRARPFSFCLRPLLPPCGYLGLPLFSLQTGPPCPLHASLGASDRWCLRLLTLEQSEQAKLIPAPRAVAWAQFGCEKDMR